jgi:thiol:disulfide interchange protein DsbC
VRVPTFKKPLIGAMVLGVTMTAGYSVAKENFKLETDSLKKSFPNLRVDSVSESPIKGLFEIVAGDQVFYFNPDGYLMFGEIWSKDGKNLTAEIRNKILAEKVKHIPLDKAMKIGTGPHQVIEFTDPDCPYCRKVDEFLTKRTDVTRYVFFFPLKQIHPEAAKKARYILSQKDREKAFLHVISGGLDGHPVADSPDLGTELEDMELVAKGIGVRGTPALWIDGTAVNGADIPRITALLDGKEVKP